MNILINNLKEKLFSLNKHISLFLKEWSKLYARDKKTKSESWHNMLYLRLDFRDIFCMQLKYIISLYKSLFRKSGMKKLFEGFDVPYYEFSNLWTVLVKMSVQN